MAKIRFPNSNSLKFVRTENNSLLQSDETRLYYDFAYTNITNDCYFTKILQSDNIWIQFRTDSVNIEAYICDVNNVETDITSYLTDGAINPNNTTQYELSLDLSAYSSYHYFKFKFIEVDSGGFIYQNTFQSEWFEVITNTTGLLKVEWRNLEFNPYNDGIIWSDTQKLWVESRLSDLVIGVEKTVFTTENYKLKTTQSQPIKSKKWDFELIPDYMVEKLNIALQHDLFYINSVRYNSDETFEAERQGDSSLYSNAIVLRMVSDQNDIGYEDYEDDADYTGEVITIPSGFFLINATDKFLINATDKLLKS